MKTSRESKVSVPDSCTLTEKEVKQRIEEHYEAYESEEKTWYRCQRNKGDGDYCNRKYLFLQGIIAHENYHNIESGNGPLINQNQTDSEASKFPDNFTASNTETDNELLESIQSDFEF